MLSQTLALTDKTSLLPPSNALFLKSLSFITLKGWILRQAPFGLAQGEQDEIEVIRV